MPLADRFLNVALSSGMLTTGSINTISKKLLYQSTGIGIDGSTELFVKPWFQTSSMFAGECMSLLAYYIVQCARKRGPTGKIYMDPTNGIGYHRLLPRIMALALCDLCATTLTGIALVYCSASITQILRGFVMVFVLLFSYLFLKRKPTKWQVVGVVFSVIGLLFVGLSALLGDLESGSTLSMLLGIGLALSAQVISAIQFVLEEKFVKGKDLSPLVLIGWEGVFGLFLTVGVAFPIAWVIPGDDHGSYENYLNSFYMLRNNVQLIALVLLNFISISFFNFFSITMSKKLSATHRTLIDAMRTSIVWICMVVVYYCTYKSSNVYGEPLNVYSIFELLGFGFMILGTVTHNDVKGFGRKVVCHRELMVPEEKEKVARNDSRVSSDDL